MMRRKKYLIFLILEITLTNKIIANTLNNNQFYRFDNNINLITAMGNLNSNYNYTDFISGLNSNILTKNNLWLNLNALLASNFQNNIAKVNRISNTNLFSIKLGPSFLTYNNQINMIPYIGLEYSGSNQTFHTNSKPEDYYATNNLGVSLGIHPEILITNNLKLTLDNNFNYTQDDDILYNNYYQELYHTNNDNFYYTVNLELQYAFNSHLNLSLNYTNYLKLNNNEDNKSNQYVGIYIGYNFY